jgi:hypothetical protein
MIENALSDKISGKKKTLNFARLDKYCPRDDKMI